MRKGKSVGSKLSRIFPLEFGHFLTGTRVHMGPNTTGFSTLGGQGCAKGKFGGGEKIGILK